MMTTAGGDNKVKFIGIDGCRAGWIAAFPEKIEDRLSPKPVFRLFADLKEIMTFAAPDATIAIDMPIGLPETITGAGREAEKTVRPLLGARQSSVFSIPSRSAVYADNYSEACSLAAQTSHPPRKVSKQAFSIFTKIRELDRLLRSGVTQSFHEVHPEFALFRLNGGVPLKTPKKIKSRVNDAGIEERIKILVETGFSREDLRKAPGKGWALDDQIDAVACLVTAFRINVGSASAFPRDFSRDAHGLPIAIWG
jgi:predicted RNase H-like nuclease